ncbi:hypothetical protein ACFVJH_23080 [Streptomyces decoyicus]|uniref:hypothetical protein n=1 Tax=Streptomyces decoyicus TaxID=249567 RepID=UPI0036442ED2
MDEEVELRFGLDLNQSLWSSFETSPFFTQFCVYRFGELVKRSTTTATRGSTAAATRRACTPDMGRPRPGTGRPSER